MILTGPEIGREVARGSIIIYPFEVSRLNPNSYDFRLSDTLAVYDEQVLDPAVKNAHRFLTIPERGLVLTPDRVYLGASQEVIGSSDYVPIIRARSSAARLGLFVHITADLIDLGYVGQITLQMHAVQPIRVYAGMEIAQVTFWKVQGEVVLYRGKYQAAVGPVPSRSYEDWDDALVSSQDEGSDPSGISASAMGQR